MTPHSEDAPELSVVVPVFDEAEVLPVLLERLSEVLDAMAVSSEVILVDDGSHDRTWELIEEARRHDGRIKGIGLARNFGHQSALFAGLCHARGRAVVTMDGDLQHPPELIPELHAAWRRGSKVVPTRRLDAGDTSPSKSLTSRWFYRVFSFLSGLQLSPGSSDFRLVDRQLLGTLRRMQDADLFLRGMVRWIGLDVPAITYRAARRHAGSTKFGVLRMLRLSLHGIVSFSSVPLWLGIWVGLATSLLAFAETAYVLHVYFKGDAVPGWASVVTVMSFMFGILFILLGIIGTYLAKIHEILKNRPRFVVARSAGIEGAAITDLPRLPIDSDRVPGG